MAHNIYIDVVITTEDSDFPNEYGVISQLRKTIREVIAKDKTFKLKRYKFDIIDQEMDIEEETEFEED